MLVLSYSGTKIMDISELSHFQKEGLIDRVARAIAASAGYRIETRDNVLQTTNPRIRVYVEMAIRAISETENYMSELAKNNEDEDELHLPETA